jgi:hypothetical protein
MARSTYDDTAVLLARQAPTGAPLPEGVTPVSDPIVTVPRSTDMLAHFFDGLYDKSPESHLSRLLKVLLGDAGMGALRKRYATARFQQVILTTHYSDLDRLYGSLFGFRRVTAEALDIDPYFEDSTPEEWEAIEARDAAYRNRVEQFSRALPLGATKAGMEAVASAVLGGTEVSVYETYLLVDENGDNAGGAPIPVGARTYGDIEQQYRFYGEIQRGTYGDAEGGSGSFGRTTTQNRSEFIVRPKRAITLEETYELIRVLSRLKPAEALLTVDSQGVAIHTPVKLRAVAADSTYWEVATKVAPANPVADAYLRIHADKSTPVPQPRPAFSGYQGEAWSYNSDVIKVSSYTESPDAPHPIKATSNYETIYRSGKPVTFTANRALVDSTRLLLGRSVSDGVLIAPVRSTTSTTVTPKAKVVTS